MAIEPLPPGTLVCVATNTAGEPGQRFIDPTTKVISYMYSSWATYGVLLGTTTFAELERSYLSELNRVYLETYDNVFDVNTVVDVVFALFSTTSYGIRSQPVGKVLFFPRLENFARVERW